MRRIVLILPLLAALCWPAAASASSRQVVTFEAPRELLSASTRDATLDQITSFGVTPRAPARVLARLRARPRQPHEAGLRRERPGRVPGRPVGQPGRARRRRRERAASTVTLTLTGPVPRWATRDKRDDLSYPDARSSARSPPRSAAATATRVSIVVDLERAQPAAVPQAAVPQRAGRTRRSSTASSTGPRTPGCARRPPTRDDTILIGETSPRGNANVVHPLAFLRGMLCLDSKWRKSKSCGALEADGYAHHAYTTSAGPALQARRTATTSRSACSRGS